MANSLSVKCGPVNFDAYACSIGLHLLVFKFFRYAQVNFQTFVGTFAFWLLPWHHSANGFADDTVWSAAVEWTAFWSAYFEEFVGFCNFAFSFAGDHDFFSVNYDDLFAVKKSFGDFAAHST